MASKKKFVVRILATIFEEEDKDFDNPKAVVLDVPVRATSSDSAQTKVTKAIGEIAERWVDQEETMKDLMDLAGISSRPRRPRPKPRRPGGYIKPQRRAPLTGEPARVERELEEMIKKFMTDVEK